MLESEDSEPPPTAKQHQPREGEEDCHQGVEKGILQIQVPLTRAANLHRPFVGHACETADENHYKDQTRK